VTDIKHNAAVLIDGVTDIIKRYAAQWQTTGEKYTLFKVADITHKEVIMCRVLADLMNPWGKHCQDSRYLRLFWEAIASKLPGRSALDIEHTRVTTEYIIDENRRIDITLEDGKVFIPIEVKIWAGDQPKQLADYFAYAQTRNKAARIPVLYLTIDGHEPAESSRKGVGKDNYVCLSFKDDILPWLQECLRDETTEKTVPVRENLKQLIAAVKSLCGKSEDVEMEDAIFKQITKDDDTGRAALAICNAADFDGKAREAFKGPITEQVTKAWPGGAEYLEENPWYYTWLPIKNGNYWLEINYLWDKLCVQVAPDAGDVSPEEKNALYEKMSGLFGLRPSPKADLVWYSEGLAWPSFVKDELYTFHLCKLYTERPQEVAEKIINIAHELEKVMA
jgi:hypothetical protein